MPLLLLPIAILVSIFVAVLIAPWTILQRYRAGTARRLARGWVALINAVGLSVSAGIFLITAGISSVWLPRALAYSAWGLAGGCAIGLLGLGLTRWEATPRTLHYTPNRWLVLIITVTVAVRLCWGVARAWNAWQMSDPNGSWLAESGLHGSMGAGAVVLGYYFAFWAGLWLRVRRHRRSAV
ncbi:MAG TPA: hypothetical protein VF614_17280 [Chthoniobacteraceae bacterium]